jgi:hypothetical protein
MAGPAYLVSKNGTGATHPGESKIEKGKKPLSRISCSSSRARAPAAAKRRLTEVSGEEIP